MRILIGGLVVPRFRRAKRKKPRRAMPGLAPPPDVLVGARAGRAADQSAAACQNGDGAPTSWGRMWTDVPFTSSDQRQRDRSRDLDSLMVLRCD